MHKNMTMVTKSKKNGQQICITINGIVVDNFISNQNTYKNYAQQKNIKSIQYQKLQTIQRHYSEDDFKKYCLNLKKIYCPDLPTKVEEQYYPQHNTSTKKIYRQIQSISKQQKLRKNNDRSIIQPSNSKINNNLKETSSTQSAENLTKPVPIYVRNKFKNNINNRQFQYISKKLSTPRSSSITRENFKIICKLGEGKFGKVFMVKQVSTGFILAMKIVEIQKIVKDNLLEQFIRELKIQTFLQHPNIISLYGFFSDETHFYILMELGCDGQLYSLILNNKLLSEESTSFIIKNLLQAIAYIHDNKVLHRDMKPQNIVLIMGNVKICDFGWAANKLHPGDLRNTFCGTPLYLSPQILQGNRYDEKVDLWAIGCNPFDINNHQDLLKIVHIFLTQSTEPIKFPDNVALSKQFKIFILSILIKNPTQRFTSRQLLKMEFITKYQDFETCEQLCK